MSSAASAKSVRWPRSASSSASKLGYARRQRFALVAHFAHGEAEVLKFVLGLCERLRHAPIFLAPCVEVAGLLGERLHDAAIFRTARL